MRTGAPSPVAGIAFGHLRFLGHDQGLVDQQCEQVEDLVAFHVAAAGDRLAGVEVEPSHKHRQPGEQDAFGLGQQRVRPIHRGPQRLLAAHRGARTPGQQPEAVMQAVADLDQRQDAHPRRRQLDRQRHAVEAPADLRRGGGVLIGEAEIGPDLARAVGEQLDRLVGQRQRRHPPTHLATNPDRLTARRHKAHRRAAAQQGNNQRGTCVQQMLTVVQHQQHPTVADKPQQRVHRGAARLVGQAQRADHRDRHDIGIGDRRQIDQPHPAGESTGDLGRQLHRQARFTDTACAGERHEPVVG